MARPTRLLAPLPTRLLGFVCILLLVSSARSPVLAQALGTLTVTARDLNGNPVANARISIARPGDDSLTATTADNGVATFDDLIPGQYYVNGVASGLTLFPDRMSASISVDVSSGQDAALAVVFFPRNPMDDAYDERTMAIVMEHVRSTRSSTVERDTGQFRNFRNDTLLSETSVDNTVAAARDIQLDSTENAIAIGGQFTFPVNPSVFILGSGSFLAQPTALTINTVQGSSTEVSGGTPIGWQTRVGVGASLPNTPVFLDGMWTYVRSGVEGLERTPASTATGGVFTSDRTELDFNQSRLEITVGYPLVKAILFGGVQRVDTDMTLSRQAEIGFESTGPGLRQEFSGTTEYTDGVWEGLIGARFSLTDGFVLSVGGTIGENVGTQIRGQLRLHP